MHSERAPWLLKLAAWGGVIFLHFPILIIATYAFNTEEAAFSFPPQGLTLKWFSVAAQRPRCGVGTFLAKVQYRCCYCCRSRCRALLPALHC